MNDAEKSAAEQVDAIYQRLRQQVCGGNSEWTAESWARQFPGWPPLAPPLSGVPVHQCHSDYDPFETIR